VAVEGIVAAVEPNFTAGELNVVSVDRDRAPVEATVELVEGTSPPDATAVAAGEPESRPRGGNGADVEATSRPVKGNANRVEGKANRVDGEAICVDGGAICLRNLARPEARYVAAGGDDGWGQRGNAESVEGSAFPERTSARAKKSGESGSPAFSARVAWARKFQPGERAPWSTSRVLVVVRARSVAAVDLPGL